MTFKQFKELHDSWREWRKKKPQNIILIVLYYPFVLFVFLLLKGIIASILLSYEQKHNRSKKFKKVIKEGLFYDSVEYHEK